MPQITQKIPSWLLHDKSEKLPTFHLVFLTIADLDWLFDTINSHFKGHQALQHPINDKTFGIILNNANVNFCPHSKIPLQEGDEISIIPNIAGELI
jgi:molybdopterin converting factor small subunit